jgi:hypothetical protein
MMQEEIRERQDGDGRRVRRNQKESYLPNQILMLINRHLLVMK